MSFRGSSNSTEERAGLSSSMSSEFGLRGPKTPWVCPSDRQLALRAKLGTGWSVKTNQFQTYPKPAPLTEKEQQAIVSVIQKAQELDLTEQQRVGKLVERLESLKSLASGNGINQCILCGDSFGLSVFGRNSYRCKDCKKAVCRKCVVDLSSTAAAAAAAAAASQSSGSGAGKESVLHLCKLCSENREFIKKSGAWFFKGVPKYVLPEKRNPYQGRYDNLTGSSSMSYQEQRYRNRYIREGQDASFLHNNVENKRSGGVLWCKNLSSRSQSEPEYDSSSGDEGIGSSATTGTASTTTSSSKTTTTTAAAPVAVATEKNNYSSRFSFKRLTSTETKLNNSRTPTSSLTPSPYEGAVTNELYEISDPTSTQGSSGVRQRSFERFDSTAGAVVESNESTSSIRDNNSRSSVSPSSADGRVRHHSFHESVPDPSASSNNSRTDFGFGVIEVSLLYDDSHQALHCSIHRARELAPTDINGLSDPYCMLKLTPTRFEGTHLRTKTVHKTLQPVFNETLTFYGVSSNEMARQSLQIDVMDEDRWGRNCLGSVQIPLHRIRPQQTRFFTLNLEKSRFTDEKDWGRGRLLLSLSFITEKSLLLVGVIRAEGLPALDHHRTSDPFVKVKLIHDSNMGSLSSNSFSVNRKFKTSVKWKTLNPEFREEFSLKVSMMDLPKLALAVAVSDRDLGNNYIGGILLSTSSKGERLKHWTDMMKLHNTKHIKWHTLSPSLVPQ